MNEEVLKKKAHEYVMTHYSSEGYGLCIGKLEENAYIAGYKVAMQRISDTIAFMKDDSIVYRQADAITVLNDIPDFLELSDEEFKESTECDDVTLID